MVVPSLLFQLGLKSFHQIIRAFRDDKEDVIALYRERRVTMEMFAEGVKRFIIGLAKKVLLANNIGLLWHSI
ncbi:hypothetical protein M3194_10735 [Paenibacillus glycanilyticus]|uniref:hypothetical protein n=1 Tax=Paenibacillus glycanilyticus TaxID=126569 RepID=UPI002040C66A|nr:hypothetical protein [Paenibacillus glycanilyticus]MCM3627840.1 hypothetical protein [Paenibacillus glycanilyticus]